MSRIPPGGHTSISLAYGEATATQAAPSTRQRTDPILGSDLQAKGELTPIRGKKKVDTQQARTNTSLFGSEASNNKTAQTSSSTAASCCTSPISPRNTVTVANPTFTSGKRIIKHTPNAQPARPALRPLSPPHAIRLQGTIASLANGTASPNTLPSHRRTAAGAASSANQLKSTIQLGDDSPPTPHFGPRKIQYARAVRKVSSRGGLADLSGFKGLQMAERVGARMDPAAVEAVAGVGSGKHRVY
ncbi:hypothetical protein BC830DRAFT_925169 [Chytriomyces sp. MP71]|nr:hypothetical protein BC830DRAFT_925169 [Chytriomyces sp. MP71]